MDHSHSNKDSGQSLVEMVVVLVLLLVLAGGIVDLGRAFYSILILRDAVHEGALYGSTDPTNTAAIKNHVLYTSDMVSGMIDSGDITVQIIDSPCSGQKIKVTADYSDFQVIMPFMAPIFGSDTLNLGATITHKIIRPSCDDS